MKDRWPSSSHFTSCKICISEINSRHNRVREKRIKVEASGGATKSRSFARNEYVLQDLFDIIYLRANPASGRLSQRESKFIAMTKMNNFCENNIEKLLASMPVLAGICMFHPLHFNLKCEIIVIKKRKKVI